MCGCFSFTTIAESRIARSSRSATDRPDFSRMKNWRHPVAFSGIRTMIHRGKVPGGMPSAPGKVPKYESNERFSWMMNIRCLSGVGLCGRGEVGVDGLGALASVHAAAITLSTMSAIRSLPWPDDRLPVDTVVPDRVATWLREEGEPVRVAADRDDMQDLARARVDHGDGGIETVRRP